MTAEAVQDKRNLRFLLSVDKMSREIDSFDPPVENYLDPRLCRLVELDEDKLSLFVNLLGKEQVIDPSSPLKHNLGAVSALLAFIKINCRSNNNVELGEVVSQTIIDLEKSKIRDYISLPRHGNIDWISFPNPYIDSTARAFR